MVRHWPNVLTASGLKAPEPWALSTGLAHPPTERPNPPNGQTRSPQGTLGEWSTLICFVFYVIFYVIIYFFSSFTGQQFFSEFVFTIVIPPPYSLDILTFKEFGDKGRS